MKKSDPVQMELRRFKGAGNVTIAADVGGDEDRPPVILIHGGGQTRHAWGGAAGALTRAGFRVISMDMRGHGDSDWSENKEYEMDDYAADLACVIDSLDRPVAIVGASMGGISGLLFCGRNPNADVSALVLVDVVPQLNMAGAERITEFMKSNVDGFESIEEVADIIASYVPNRQRPKDLSGLEKNLRIRNGRYFWHWDPAMLGDGDDHADQIDETSRKMKQCATGVKVPTLLVRGSLSDIVTPEGVKELQELIPHSEYVDVKDASHMVAGDKNDRFNQAVVEFLTRITDDVEHQSPS